MPPVILAVDQGSSSSRCMVLDRSLRVLGSASCEVTTLLPRPGWVEHDAEEIVSSVLGVVRVAMNKAALGWDAVVGIGLAGQTETFVVWDRDSGKAVYPAISWRDSRAAGLCESLRDAGLEDHVRSHTGLPLQPAFSASKLRWLLDEIPGARDRAAAGRLLFGDVNSWLTWCLSGGRAHVTEPSMAARTMLFNLGTLTWDDDLLELFGIPRQMLPAVVPTAGHLATTDPSVCGGRAVVGGSIGDQQAALFGQRCWREGMAKLTLGTGAFLWCHAGMAPPPAVSAGVVSGCAWQFGGETAYALEGFVPNAGAVTAWLRHIGVLEDGEWPRIREDALHRPATRPWCVPALFGIGTPNWVGAARADIIGLTAASTADDIAEAALLGVVHQIVDAIEAVRSGLRSPMDLVRVDGGLASNDSVLQAIADLAVIRLQRSTTDEASALGAGILGALGADLLDMAAVSRLPFAVDVAAAPSLPAELRDAARVGWKAALSASLAGWAAAEHRD
jgi:glycerol kinase